MRLAGSWCRNQKPDATDGRDEDISVDGTGKRIRRDAGTNSNRQYFTSSDGRSRTTVEDSRSVGPFVSSYDQSIREPDGSLEGALPMSTGPERPTFIIPFQSDGHNLISACVLFCPCLCSVLDGLKLGQIVSYGGGPIDLYY